MVPSDVFSTFVKAAIVRNPFDYAVSWYFWERTRVTQTSREDFWQWLRFQFHHRPEIEADYHQRRRSNPGVFASNRFITHIGGKCAMDVMLRYEHFQEDATRFAERVGLPPSLGLEFKDIRAKGHYRPATATARLMFDGFSDGQEMIRQVFADEIASYQYALT